MPINRKIYLYDNPDWTKSKTIDINDELELDNIQIRTDEVTIVFRKWDDKGSYEFKLFNFKKNFAPFKEVIK